MLKHQIPNFTFEFLAIGISSNREPVAEAAGAFPFHRLRSAGQLRHRYVHCCSSHSPHPRATACFSMRIVNLHQTPGVFATCCICFLSSKPRFSRKCSQREADCFRSLGLMPLSWMCRPAEPKYRSVFKGKRPNTAIFTS